MRTIMPIMFAAIIALGVPNAVATVQTTPIIGQEEAEHGGGCRKSSPPGMCCHMETRTGTVHCH